MEALFLLIPLSLLGVGTAIWFFLRMNASGQFDDTEGPAWRVLMDDDSNLTRESGAGSTAGKPVATGENPTKSTDLPL